MARPTAFVTGASYGVGRATSLALARAGYDVAISATRPENVESTAVELKELDARVVVVTLDLRDQGSIEQAFGAVLSAFGTLDLLVNNAGANLRKLAVDVTAAEWDEVIATNLTGTFFLTQQFGRHLLAHGRPGCVVNVASTHGLVGAAERSTYGVSKAAIVQMTRMLAIEWAAHRIRVNAVAPGRLDTPSPSRADTDPKYMAAMLARIPMHRLATAEEVAAAICYLASAEAGSVTGQIIVLDGGLTAA
jgi:NAD(P)-dependent dehydrogenase (short-subunit alcohol dehydrogenase family)